VPHKTDTTLTGAAGEHLVLSRLLQRGVLAAPAPRGASKVDILVNFLDERAPVLLQVKARQFGSDGGWHMSEKHEHAGQEGVFFCFVDFEPGNPSAFVIPSQVVAEAVTLDHAAWLAAPGKNGQPHKPTSMRRLRPSMFGMAEGWMKEYLEAWHLIIEAD
jgi:hypothetical protein